MTEPLYVVTAISNPSRYKSRYRLYHDFARQVACAGGILYTVEMAFGDREPAVTDSACERHIIVRGDHELWHKENLLNIGIAHLPPAAKYVATIDADLTFGRHDWCRETVEQLQHFPALQMFSQVQQLNSAEESIGTNPSFVASWLAGNLLRTCNGEARSDAGYSPGMQMPIGYATTWLGSPGGAWAYRREALNQLGGLIDFSLIGSGDYFMAAGLFGLMQLVLSPEYSDSFKAALLQWQARAERYIRHNVGCMSGTVLHHWHGPMASRGYGDRWKILTRHKFCPHADLMHDSQGLLRLHDDGSDRFIRLRDDLRRYFRSRNEDQV